MIAPKPIYESSMQALMLVPDNPAVDFITGTTTLSAARTFNDQVSSSSAGYVAVSAADLAIDVKIGQYQYAHQFYPFSCICRRKVLYDSYYRCYWRYRQ